MNSGQCVQFGIKLLLVSRNGCGGREMYFGMSNFKSDSLMLIRKITNEQIETLYLSSTSCHKINKSVGDNSLYL